MRKQRFIIILIGIAILLMCSSIYAASNDTAPIVFKGTTITTAVQNIGRHFGVVVIADPLLKGNVSQTIDVNCTIEEALQQVLKPYGYFYSKVDDYYLVGGPASPLTVFADTESSLVPVGFLNKRDQSKLEKYKQYIVYDAKSGMLFIKAPTSIMNAILADLWGGGASGNQLNVIYSFRVVDFAYVPDFDLYFEGSYTNQDSSPHEIIINAEQISRHDGWNLLINKKVEAFSLKTTRQPWIAVLPGKTMKFNTTYHWATTREDLQDRKIIFEITPLSVDESAGEVVSDIKIGQDEPAQGTALKSNSLLSIVKTKTSQPQVVALVRSFGQKSQNVLFGKRQIEEVRDYAVIMTVYPLRMQKDQDTASSVTSLGDFAGLDTLLGETAPSEDQPLNYLILGISSADDAFNPWLNLGYHISRGTALGLEYLNSDDYSLSLSSQLFSIDLLTLEVLAGDGVGPDHSRALLLGFGDETVLNKQVSIFAKYYPFVFGLNDKIEKHAVWHLGTHINAEQLGVSCMAIGDENFEGWDLRFNYDWGSCSLSFGGNTFDDETNYILGWGFKL